MAGPFGEAGRKEQRLSAQTYGEAAFVAMSYAVEVCEALEGDLVLDFNVLTYNAATCTMTKPNFVRARRHRG